MSNLEESLKKAIAERDEARASVALLVESAEAVIARRQARCECSATNFCPKCRALMSLLEAVDLTRGGGK